MKKLIVFMVFCLVSTAFADSDEEYFLNRKHTKIEEKVVEKIQPKVTNIDAFTKKGCHYIAVEIDNSGLSEIFHNPNCDNHNRNDQWRRDNSSRNY